MSVLEEKKKQVALMLYSLYKTNVAFLFIFASTSRGVRNLQPDDFLYITSNGSIKWTSSGLSECTLEHTYKDSTFGISYAVKTPQAASETVSEHIFIDRTTCKYGGTRTWFSCPACNTRKAILYCVSKRFLCHQCYGLNYS
jgi:hypothetical protein